MCHCNCSIFILIGNFKKGAKYFFEPYFIQIKPPHYLTLAHKHWYNLKAEYFSYSPIQVFLVLIKVGRDRVKKLFNILLICHWGEVAPCSASRSNMGLGILFRDTLTRWLQSSVLRAVTFWSMDHCSTSLGTSGPISDQEVCLEVTKLPECEWTFGLIIFFKWRKLVSQMIIDFVQIPTSDRGGWGSQWADLQLILPEWLDTSSAAAFLASERAQYAFIW